jgi:hypothetical protein
MVAVALRRAPVLLQVRLVANELYTAQFLDHLGMPYAGIYREVCRESWRNRPNHDLVRSSDWGGRAYRCLEFAWDLTDAAIEAHTKLEIAELPRELLVTMTQIVLDPRRDWDRAAERVDVIV